MASDGREERVRASKRESKKNKKDKNVALEHTVDLTWKECMCLFSCAQEKLLSFSFRKIKCFYCMRGPRSLRDD